MKMYIRLDEIFIGDYMILLEGDYNCIPRAGDKIKPKFAIFPDNEKNAMMVYWLKLVMNKQYEQEPLCNIDTIVEIKEKMYNEVKRYLEKIGEIDENGELYYSSLIESMCEAPKTHFLQKDLCTYFMTTINAYFKELIVSEVSWEPDEDNNNTMLIPIISVRYKQSIH